MLKSQWIFDDNQLEQNLTDIDQSLFSYLPFDLVLKYQCIPIFFESGLLYVAVADKNDIFLHLALEAQTKEQITLCQTSLESLEYAIQYWSDRLDQLYGLTEELGLLKVSGGDGNEEEGVNDKTQGPIVTLMNTIISTALQKRASDIHIEVFERSIAVKYRIDGALIPAMPDLDQAHHSALISRLKVMAELDIAEKRIPQDGRFQLSLSRRDIDFRLSILPSLHGENAVIRILDGSSNRVELMGLSLERLGMSDGQREVFEKAIHEPYGMVLMTGPTGSGKTTTLYTALTEINSGDIKIITIEDPVEYNLSGITQIPVNIKKGLTFASGLRSILRHDPDKILVGEIRDGETANIAIQSALTGHLVFSSVHANSAVDVLARLQNMGADAHNSLSAINCVVAQRLVRLNCPDCKAVATYDKNFLQSFNLDMDQLATTKFYKGAGCDSCNYTGYLGRAMVCEVVEFTKAVSEAVMDGKTVVEALGYAKLAGDVSLRQSSLARVLSGDTSLEEVNRVTFAE